ncbi:response regulator transcription factor [bacterium]|nr:response regulator transcription factor [bacterium]
MREFKKKARILLVDDNAEHLRGIKELISLETNYDIVGTTTSANIGINLVKKYHPEVVIMDINLPEKDGLQAIQEIEKLELGTKVLVLSGYDDSDLIFRAMKLGARGYILKTMSSAQLVYAIDEILAGKFYLPAALSSRFFDYFQQSFKAESASSSEENLLTYLTSREEEVLELLTQGNNYKGIAGKLFISETTVKTHVNNIFQKLQVNDRTQAVLYALNNGFGRKVRAKISA